MKAYVRYIGVVDHQNVVHAVTFTRGVNVITGKSSTGKSAIMEIFDYCFASSDFTVPEGVITRCSAVYFVVICVKNAFLVLGRIPDANSAFIREESDESVLSNKDSFRREYFSAPYFLPIENFKKELRRYFGPRLTDVDESTQEKKAKGRKSPGPSVRSFMSFMLQHQNLVANKHAIFYRFDEKEKREQTIEHFKIFAGFVDQKYFLMSQKIDELRGQERQIEKQIHVTAAMNEHAREILAGALQQYAAMSGAALQIGEVTEVLQNPARALEAIKAQRITVLPLSDVHARQRAEYEDKKTDLIAKLRRLRNKLGLVKSSIDFAKNYVSDASSAKLPTEADLRVSVCPFCKQYHHSVELAANKLENAISWLNEELRRTPYSLESFEEDAAQLSKEIERTQLEIHIADQNIEKLDRQIADLAQHRSQYELTLKAKIQIEALLENLITQNDYRFDQKLISISKEIERLRTILKAEYSLESKLNQAEEIVNSIMDDIGKRFDFEESFLPIKLRFSLRTFDLWHQTEDGRRIFLRSMGSGANWLYCHLTLFLALHRYFCFLGDKCSIPSILFIDQPSQVYFPSILDHEASFDPQKLAQLAGRAAESVDEDVRAVTNLYSQLVKFCQETLETTGIEPQIIVTDHADRLRLTGDVAFDALVQDRRWRKRGFIHPVASGPEGAADAGSVPEGAAGAGNVPEGVADAGSVPEGAADAGSDRLI